MFRVWKYKMLPSSWNPFRNASQSPHWELTTKQPARSQQKNAKLQKENLTLNGVNGELDVEIFLPKNCGFPFATFAALSLNVCEHEAALETSGLVRHLDECEHCATWVLLCWSSCMAKLHVQTGTWKMECNGTCLPIVAPTQGAGWWKQIALRKSVPLRSKTIDVT